MRTRRPTASNTADGTSSTTVGTMASASRAAATRRSSGYVSSVGLSSTSYRLRSWASMVGGSRRTTKTRGRAPRLESALGSALSAGTRPHGHDVVVSRGARRDWPLAPPYDGRAENQSDGRDRNVLDQRNEKRDGNGAVSIEPPGRRGKRVEQLEHADVPWRQSDEKARVHGEEREQRPRGRDRERRGARRQVKRGPLSCPRDAREREAAKQSGGRRHAGERRDESARVAANARRERVGSVGAVLVPRMLP